MESVSDERVPAPASAGDGILRSLVDGLVPLMTAHTRPRSDRGSHRGRARTLPHNASAMRPKLACEINDDG